VQAARGVSHGHSQSNGVDTGTLTEIAAVLQCFVGAMAQFIDGDWVDGDASVTAANPCVIAYRASQRCCGR